MSFWKNADKLILPQTDFRDNAQPFHFGCLHCLFYVILCLHYPDFRMESMHQKRKKEVTLLYETH